MPLTVIIWTKTAKLLLCSDRRESYETWRWDVQQNK